jgi:hypothetical protein
VQDDSLSVVVKIPAKYVEKLAAFAQ